MAIFNPRHSCWEDAFHEALNSIGGTVPKVISADGTIHRFSFNGRYGNDSGWYIIYQDEITAGVIGSWGTGQKVTWHYSPKGYEWTPEKQSALHKKAEERFKEAEIKRKADQSQAAIEAKAKWETLQPASPDHPYLINKGIKPFGIRIGKSRLCIPMLDESGDMVSYQTIDDKGVKLFMKNGRAKGCYFILGAPKDRIFIAEGYATASSIHEASGEAVAVVFDAGNMVSAVKSLKIRYPSLIFKVCADNDRKGNANIGLQAAENVHAEFGIDYIYPEFTDEESANGASDFNDYARLRGFDALKAIFSGSETKKYKFTPLSFTELMSMPRPEWVIEGIFTTKSFGVIYGKPESCKTFVAIDMALCVAHGMQWHGRDVIQGSVLYVVGEGMGGLGKRLKAWQYEYCYDKAIPPFYAITSNVNFRDPTDITELLSSIESLNQKFSLIIIDTVARAMTGGEENDTVDMGLFVLGCDQIKDKASCAVIGIHHNGKDEAKGMRGSTALLGAVDTVIYSEQPVQGTVILTNQKQKDGEHFSDLNFKTVQIITGLRETSLIVESLNDSSHVYQKKVNGKSDLYLESLWDCIASDNKTLNGFPATNIENWKNMCVRRNLGGDNPEAMRKGFYRARVRLHENKLIFIDGNLVCVVERKNNGQ